jgi:hypothetical protein
MNSVQLELSFFHADGRTGRLTDMMKLTVTFRNFSNEKNPHLAFLRRGSKAVCTMSQLCGM